MSSVYIISSVAVVAFILLHASFCTVVKERSPRADWTEQSKKIPYLAIVKHGSEPTEVCSGSIPSISTVLTYCDKEVQGKKAYAGLLNVAEAQDNPKDGVQQREVKLVQHAEELKNLKICEVDDWEFNSDVGFIKLPVSGESQKPPSESCTVVSFQVKDKTYVVNTMTQKIIKTTTVCDMTEKPGYLLSEVTATQKFSALDMGAPAVCDNVQWRIYTEFLAKKTGRTYRENVGCNLFVDIGIYSKWINEAMTEKPEPGGPGGSNSTISSGYSIHSYLNKYSHWKVLGFLLFTIVIFLQ